MFYQSQLHYNSILTNSIDNYCLVCDSYLRSEDEAITHTEKPIHKKNIGAATRLERYAEDQIIKVKRGYFCTFCNILLSTTTKVNLHIGDINHRENKGAQMLNRVGDDIIAFDEVVISLQSWHGMTENTCVICNTEFDKDDIHRSEQFHMLKLIQSKCEFGDKYVYRKVDEDSFFCLTCGGVFAISEKPEHHEKIKHTILYNYGKELKDNAPTVPQVKTKKTTQVAPGKPGSGTKNKSNAITGPVAETDKNSNATSAKKKAAAVKPDASTPSSTSIGDVDSKKTEPVDKRAGASDVEQTEMINAKNDTDDDKNTDSFHATKEETPNTQDSVKHVDDFFESATKLISTDKDLKIEDYMSVSNYIVQDGDLQKRCVLCDVICIRKEDVKVHLSNDLHHQMMLKKHKETLYKKENGPTAEINEIFPADNLVQYRGKIYLDQPENAAVCAAVGHTKPIIKETIPQQRPLETGLRLDIQSKIRRHNPDSDVSSDEDEEYTRKILDKVDKFQVNDITVDVASEKAYCKQCDENLAFDPDVLERHIDEQHPNKNAGNIFTEKVDSRTLLVTYARENHMVVMKSEAFCKLCKSASFLSMECMAEHVNSSSHKDKVLNKNGVGPLKKVQASYSLNTFFRVESSLGSDIILNNKYALRHYSFHCVILRGENYKCVLCNIDFSKDGGEQLTEHLNTFEHKRRLGLCNIVTSLPVEFIREIRSSLYHCGFCNKVTDCWPLMEEHLLHQSHLYARRHARWNLERFHTAIRNAKAIQQSRRVSNDSNQSPLVIIPMPPPPQPEPAPERSPSMNFLMSLRNMSDTFTIPQQSRRGTNDTNQPPVAPNPPPVQPQHERSPSLNFLLTLQDMRGTPSIPEQSRRGSSISNQPSVAPTPPPVQPQHERSPSLNFLLTLQDMRGTRSIPEVPERASSQGGNPR